ncbi:hypothetical protein ACO0LO_21565 [Undibacterium sp. TJN25]|uniref:hypothetical protein n=1 Tax=Undibacterium sp. TJN25 TaxID=3413056 RepID=UPI003BF44FD3
MAALFAVGVLSQSATFFILPFLVPLLTGLTVAVVGVAASSFAFAAVYRLRNLHSVMTSLIVVLIWLAWIFVPTAKLSVWTRFELQRPSYDLAVADIKRGVAPRCLQTHDCEISSAAPGYVVFPFPGFLSGWQAVVYAPTGIDSHFSDRQAFAASAYCDKKPLSGPYYLCTFY